MSLINQVLRDLENRRHQKNVSIPMMNTQTLSAERKTHFKKWLVISLGVVATLSLMILAIVFSKHLKPLPIPAKTLKESRPVFLAKLLDINFSQENNIELVSLQFSKNLEKNPIIIPTQKITWIFIPKLSIEPNWQNVNTENHSIEKIIAHKNSSWVVLEFQLKQQIKYLQSFFEKQNRKKFSLSFSNNLDKSTPHTTTSDESINNSNTIIKIDHPPSLEEIIANNYQKALILINSGREDLAEQLLKQNIRMVPLDNASRQLLSTELFNNQKFNEAAEILDEGIKLAPDYFLFTQLKANILSIQGKKIEAFNLLKNLSPDISQATDYYALEAGLAEQLGNYKQAAQLYNQLLQVSPNNGVWWVGFGVALENENQLTAAEQAYQRALSTNSLPENLTDFVNKQIEQLQE